MVGEGGLGAGVRVPEVPVAVSPLSSTGSRGASHGCMRGHSLVEVPQCLALEAPHLPCCVEDFVGGLLEGDHKEKPEQFRLHPLCLSSYGQLDGELQ